MSEKCISGRHNYEHLGTSCDDMDEQLRVARDIALSGGTSIRSTGPAAVWDQNGDPVLDAVIPEGFDAASGKDIYASGHIGTPQYDDDAQDD